MKILSNILGTVAALAFAAALCVGGYLAAKRFVVFFARLDFPVAMVTGTSVAAILLASMIIAAAIRGAGAGSATAAQRAAKTETYRLFVRKWEELLRPGQPSDGRIQHSDQIREISHLLALHGSTTVLKAHADLQSLDLAEARTRFATTLLQVRKELGLDSRGFGVQELQQLLFPEAEAAARASQNGVRHDTSPRMSFLSNP